MEWRDWVHYWNHLNQYCDDLWNKKRVNSEPNDNGDVNLDELNLQDSVDAVVDDIDDEIFVYENCEECLRKLACVYLN